MTFSLPRSIKQDTESPGLLSVTPDSQSWSCCCQDVRCSSVLFVHVMGKQEATEKQGFRNPQILLHHLLRADDSKQLPGAGQGITDNWIWVQAPAPPLGNCSVVLGKSLHLSESGFSSVKYRSLCLLPSMMNELCFSFCDPCSQHRTRYRAAA